MTKIHHLLTVEEESVARQLVDIAFTIHATLGPGLSQSVYQQCFCHELKKKGILFAKQQMIAILYDGMELDERLLINILVNDKIVVELKAQDNYHPVWEAQLLSYLKLTGNRLGFLFNFHVPLMKDGIKRMIV